MRSRISSSNACAVAMNARRGPSASARSSANVLLPERTPPPTRIKLGLVVTARILEQRTYHRERLVEVCCTKHFEREHAIVGVAAQELEQCTRTIARIMNETAVIATARVGAVPLDHARALEVPAQQRELVAA